MDVVLADMLQRSVFGVSDTTLSKVTFFVQDPDTLYTLCMFF